MDFFFAWVRKGASQKDGKANSKFRVRSASLVVEDQAISAGLLGSSAVENWAEQQ